MTFAGENPGIIKAEMLNLNKQREGVSANIKNYEKTLTKLYYSRAGLITNLNIILAQVNEKNIPEGIKKNLIEKTSFIKNDLANIQYQIDTIQERIRGSKSSEYLLSGQITIREKILSSIVLLFFMKAR